MDGALQATIGLSIGNGNTNDTNGNNNKPALPFALEELEIYDKCKSDMWAIVRKSEGSKPEDKVQKVDIDIYSEKEGEAVVHSQGRAQLFKATEEPWLDIQSIQDQCVKSRISPDQCYEAFAASGIVFGPGHKGIGTIYSGEGQVLSKLILPSSVFDTIGQFFLHPSMLDSALQSSIGLMIKDKENNIPQKPFLPFSLESIEIFGPCTTEMWAHIKYSEGNKRGDAVLKQDINLCDENGKVRVQMKGFTSRVFREELLRIETREIEYSEYSGKDMESVIEAATLIPIWDKVPIEKTQFVNSRANQIVIGGTNENRAAIQQHYPQTNILEIQSKDTIKTIEEKLKLCSSIDHIFWIAPNKSVKSITDNTLIHEQSKGVLNCFRTIKAMLGLGYGEKDLAWTIITYQTQSINKGDNINPTHATIHGLAGSMAKEYPNWKIRLVDLEADKDWPIDDIITLLPDSEGNAWCYRTEAWHRQKLIPARISPFIPDQTIYKREGVYVIIGGAGGIGEVWSEYMIRSYQARIIWIGRRQKDESIQAKIDSLSRFGEGPYYIAADATNHKALQKAYEEIKERYKHINGVIHSAIVLLDKSLMNMDEERFKAGLSVKVDTSVYTAQIFGKENLDFVLFFSSVNSFVRGAGQSNYAAGCTFMDAFAYQLAREWPCKIKVINWGYWGNFGVVASKKYQDIMAKGGIGSIEPPEAMKALEQLLSGSINQIVLFKKAKPISIKDIKYPMELITILPEKTTSIINIIQKNIPKSDFNIEQMKPEDVSFQINDMEMLLTKLLWEELRSTGAFGERETVKSDIKTKTGIINLYDRWLEESIEVLVRKHYLKKEGENYVGTDLNPADKKTVWEEWEKKKIAWLENQTIKAQAVLAEATLRALPEILRGDVPATEIMFPNSGMGLVEGIYKDNVVSDYFNDMLANAVEVYIQERLKENLNSRIRIIEIGAGTGGTSRKVFQKIKQYQEHIEEYCYTDISKAFLIHAEEEYGKENPYLTYKIFNVELPIAGQGIEEGEYDIVIAAKVLHATRNILETIRNAKATLKKNGLIVLNEIINNNLFTHLTFGLLEGWWLYEDPELRIPGSPALSSEKWQFVLESEGFRSVFSPTKQTHTSYQQIIIGESDGIIRQKKELKQNSIPLNQGIETKA